MVKPLPILLEREFRLCYHIPGFSLSDLRKTDSRILDWYYSRLLKQLDDEKKTLSSVDKDFRKDSSG